jgi:hypothetical protein
VACKFNPQPGALFPMALADFHQANGFLLGNADRKVKVSKGVLA